MILALQQIGHGEAIAYIAHIDADLVADVRDIERISPIFRDQAIGQGDVRALRHQSTRQTGADESEAAGDQDILAGIGIHDRFAARTAWSRNKSGLSGRNLLAATPR